MATQKVNVRFNSAIAGLGDMPPVHQESHYRRLGSRFQQDGLAPIEIEAKIREMRKTDAAAIKTGFTREFAFKTGDTALLNREIAEAWQNAGTCTILVEAK